MSDSRTPYYATPRQPRLIWNNRDKKRVAEALPAQTVEIISPFYQQAGQSALDMRMASKPENRLIWTNDNLVALTSLLAGDGNHEPLEGKVDLIYIDPPFAVQSDFKINVEIEDGLNDEKLPTLIEELAYTDTWKDGLDSYLAMMRDRLELLKRLLAPTGSIYVHCDWHAGHYLKVLMDEVFGYENFRNEVVWQRTSARSDSHTYNHIHDVIYLYSASNKFTYNVQHTEYSEKYKEDFYRYVDENGRRYRLGDLTGAGTRRGETGQTWRGVNPTDKGRHWAYKHSQLEEYDKQGKIYWPPKGGVPSFKRFLDEQYGVPLQSIWSDIGPVGAQAAERTSFPTQKPVTLLQRIIAASSNEGNLILDCFSGSGTTALVAETMKDADGKPAPRRWIAIDCGKFAVHITRKRLIEAGARPFAVENIGFYARQGEWKDIWQANPSAKMYRNAMVEVYGGATVEGFTYLHGKKGARWVHVGPLNQPVADGQMTRIVEEAAATDTKAVDILSADIPIDWNKSEIEQKYGVSVYARIIPQVAIDAVRERIRRRRQKDPRLEPAPDIHFFSPPDIEVRADVTRNGKDGSVVVKLTRLTVDLDDCLATQDAAKRAEIKKRLTDWKALIDYWAVDWDYNGEWFANDWQSFRTRKNKAIATQAARDYPGEQGDKRIAVKVTDIFGNDGVKVIRVTL